MLTVLGHEQGPTPVKTDNQTASAFVNNTLKAKRSKTWDMRYFWLKDRISQAQFMFIGKKDPITMEITGLNIGHLLIINVSDQSIF